MKGKTIFVLVLVLGLCWTIPAIGADTEESQEKYIAEPTADEPSSSSKAASEEAAHPDPLAPFNEKMFWFNRELDEYVVRPVASAVNDVTPEPPRRAVDRFFTNVGVIPRFANSLFQLKFVGAGREASRFLINSTVGLVGFFDPADKWLGLKPSNEDFGLTLGHYGVDTGPYLMLPLLGPSTVRDAVGRVADGFMNPISYFLPFFPEVFAINSGVAATHQIDYESLNLGLFADVDRYSVDLYGAVQDGYLQRRKAQLDQ